MGIYSRSIRRRVARRSVSRRWGRRSILKNKIQQSQSNLSTHFFKRFQKIVCKPEKNLNYLTMADRINPLNADDKAMDDISENRKDDANIKQDSSALKDHNFSKLLEFARKAVQSDVDVDIDQLRNAVNFMQAWKRSILRDMCSN